MSQTDILIQTADVLEKAAAYIEELETTKVAAQKVEQEKEASKLAQQVADAVGEPVSEALVEKLSGASPDVRDLIERMSSDDLVEPMGGPVGDNVKTASVNPGIGSAEASLLSWLQTP